MNLENEIWKDVVGYEGLYQVSNLGRVRSIPRTCISKFGSIRTVPSRNLSPSNGRGYLYYNLNKDGICKRVLAHRIVASAFIPNPKGHKTVNHKDENKVNNNVSNLEWCSHKYNNDYGQRKRKVSDTCFKNRRNCRVIQHIDSYGNIIKEYNGIKYAAIELGVNKGLIINILRGVTKTKREHLLFRYKEGTTWYNHKRI